MITQDDILYMIVTDRFADGDPANNGETDRASLSARHGGDLLGILQRLPYLKDLGVTALWITPVYVNGPEGYHGYHPIDFEAVDPHLCSPELGPSGSRETLRTFVEQVHEHGLKVVLDVVVNHTGPDHPWRKSRPEWFNPDLPTLEKSWLWGLPDLNHDNLDVNWYFIRNVLEWIRDTGADAVRIDAVRHVETEFWRSFKLFAHGEFLGCSLIGEVWDGDVHHVAAFQAEQGFDVMFDFPLQMAAGDVFARDAPFGRIARPELGPNEPEGVLNLDGAYRNAYQLVTFLENHDTPRFYHLCGGDPQREEALSRTRLALAFLFTTRGIPQLYYGSELAMDGGPHPDNRRDMPWERLTDPGEVGKVARGMLDWVRRLTRLRRESRALRYGALVTLYVTPMLYAFTRYYPGDARLVVLNNSPEATEVTIPLRENPRVPTPIREAAHDGRELIDDLGDGSQVRIQHGCVTVRIPARSAAVYRAAL